MDRRSFVMSGLAIAGSATLGAEAALAQAKSKSKGGAWVQLFDGKTLDNWTKIGEANWRVVEGSAQADQGSKAGFLVSKATFRDFTLRAEFWADEKANSGIFIRCSDPKEITAKNAYEVNIFDQRPDPSYGTAAIVDVAKVEPMPKAAGKWNTFEVTAKGDHLVVIFNGQKTVDVKDAKHASGPIGLQWAAGVIKFRKVEIRPM